MADNITRLKLEIDTHKALRQLQDFEAEEKKLKDVAEAGTNASDSDEVIETTRKLQEEIEKAEQKQQELNDLLKKGQEYASKTKEKVVERLKSDDDFRSQVIEMMKADGKTYELGGRLQYKTMANYAFDNSVEGKKLNSGEGSVREELAKQNEYLTKATELRQKLIQYAEELQKIEQDSTSDEGEEVGNKEKEQRSYRGLIDVIKKYGFALLGATGAFAVMRKALSSYLSTNEETANKLQSVWRTIGAVLGPIIDWIAQRIANLSAYINYFVKALTGVDLVARANARSLNKQAQAQQKLRQSASFDEQNKLSDSSGGGSGGAGMIDLPEIPAETAQKIQKIADALKPLWTAIKGVFGFILDNWQAVVIAVTAVWAVLNAGAILSTLGWGALIAVIASVIGWLHDNWDAIVAWYNTNIAPWLGGVIDWVCGVFNDFVSFFVNLWNGFLDIMDLIFADSEQAFESGGLDIIWGLLGGLWKAIKGIGTWMWEHIVKPIIDAFCALLGIHSPSTVFEGFGENIIQGLLAGLKAVIGLVKTFFVNAVQWVYQKFNELIAWIASKISAVVGVFQKIWDGIKGVFGSVADWFRNVFSSAWEKVKSVFSAGSEVFSGIKEAISTTFKTIVNKLIGGINAVIAWPFNKINGFLNKIREASFLGIQPFKDKWGYNPIYVPQIPYLAKGGIAVRPTSAIIGEAGKEAVLPLENNLEWMDKLADKIASNITIEAIPLNVDGKKVAQIVFKTKAQMSFVNNRGY